MRKFYYALLIALFLAAPALYAEDTSSVASDPENSNIVTEAVDDGDTCREECAEDGADPDECQMDCNTVT